VPGTVCVAGETAGGPTSKVTVAFADPPVALPLIVIVAEEDAVGVPEMTPVDVFKVNPVGNEPVSTEYDTVNPPKNVAVNAADGVIALPVGPEIVCVAGAIVRSPMLNVTIEVAVPDVAPVAVIVTTAEDDSVGVPEIAPVEELRLKPVGRVPEVTA
jgi:hypothetical protein